MRLTDYHALRTGIQRNASPVTPPAIADLAQRLRSTLVASGLFHTVEVEGTDDVDRLVIALAQYGPGHDAAQVAARLEQLWHDVLAYPFWSAEALLVDEGQVELQGATRSSQYSGYLTLHLVAQASAAPAHAPATVVIPTQPARTDRAGQSSPSPTTASATRRP